MWVSFNLLGSVDWCSELGNQSQVIRRVNKFSANTARWILRSTSPPVGLLPHEIWQRSLMRLVHFYAPTYTPYLIFWKILLHDLLHLWGYYPLVCRSERKIRLGREGRALKDNLKWIVKRQYWIFGFRVAQWRILIAVISNA